MITVAHYAGTSTQIGAAHGEQFKTDLATGMPAFYRDLWQRIQGELSKGLVGRAAQTVLFQVRQRLIRQLPQSMLDLLSGVAAASGFSVDELHTATIMPDLFPFIQGWRATLFKKSYVLPRSPVFGCTSFLVGELGIQGRNLDFPGIGFWDRHPLIQVTSKTGKLKVCSFTAKGVPMPGITGINEAGLCIALHQHYSRDVSTSGALPFVIAAQILEEARDLKVAAQMLREAQIATAWAFVVTQGHEGFVCEASPKTRSITQYQDFAHANRFQTGPCQRYELSTSESMNWNNGFRRQRLLALLPKCDSVASACAIISDSIDAHSGKERICARTIAQTHNIQSLVFDHKARQVYVAVGPTPVQQSLYQGFSLDELFSGREGRLKESHDAYQYSSDGLKVAKAEFSKSFGLEMAGDRAGAEAALQRSVTATLQPENAYNYSIQLARRGESREALKICEQGLAAAPDSPERDELALLFCRLTALTSGRAAAKAASKNFQAQDSNIRRLLEKAEYFRAPHRLIPPYSLFLPIT